VFLLSNNVRNRIASPFAEFATKARVGDVHNAILHLLNDRVVNDIAVATTSPSQCTVDNIIGQKGTAKYFEVGAIKLLKEKRLTNNEHMVTVIADHVQPARGVPVAEDSALLTRLNEVRGRQIGGKGKVLATWGTRR
jgi:hypothetical protein